MEILSLTTKHVADVAMLSQSFFQEEGSHKLKFDQIERELKQQLTQGFLCRGVKVDSQFVAMCLFRLEPSRTFIKRLYTLPEFRKRGFAKALVDSLQEYEQSIYLHVAPNNRAAMNFYEHLGGAEVFRTYEFKVK